MVVAKQFTFISADYNSSMLTDSSLTEPYMECLIVENILANKKY